MGHPKGHLLAFPQRQGRSLHSDPWREGHRAGQEAGGGGSSAEAADQQTTARTLATRAPGGPWPLSPVSDAWKLTIANWPTVSCRVDP